MSTTSFTVTAKANCPKCDGVGLFVGASNRLTLCECASSVPSSVVLAVDPAERSGADSWSTPQPSALAPPTPEQPAVTGEPTLHEVCPVCERPRLYMTARSCSDPFHASSQENIGIPQTASGPSRPTVESDGSARGRVNVTQMGGDAKMCRKCGVEGVEVNEQVTARKGAGIYPDTPPVVARQFFMRCPKCAAEWNLHEQAMLFERELSAVTFHEYRRITAEQSAALAIAQQRIAELSTRDPVSRTLGATDSPREDSTDVDRAWYIVEHSAIYDPPVVQRAIDQLRSLLTAEQDCVRDLSARLERHETALSSTRTALQRVREAATAVLDGAVKQGLTLPLPSGRSVYYVSSRYVDALRAALTSTETDQ